MSESEGKSNRSREEVLQQLRAQIDGIVAREPAGQAAEPSRGRIAASEPEPGELAGPFDHILQSRRAIRMKQISEAARLIQSGLERFPDEPHLLLEWSKFLEHRRKDYAGALEYAEKVPDEIEGSSNRDRRIHRLRRRAERN